MKARSTNTDTRQSKKSDKKTSRNTGTDRHGEEDRHGMQTSNVAIMFLLLTLPHPLH